ncbi:MULTISPECIES: 2-aminoethylphosphonate--pyruvate transaminase [Chitinophagaceae]
MKSLLFTPGPLTTSATVKEAMLSDVGSRDDLFVRTVQEVRAELLRIAHVSKEDGYETVLMQGAGTFGIESVLSSAVNNTSKLLILANGAYGERQVQIAEVYKLAYDVIRFPENEIVDPNIVDAYLNTHPEITHVSVIHSETTTGLFNPIQAIGDIVAKHGKKYIIDAMSSFGGVEMNIKDLHVNFIVSSSNKCVEGIPGFSWIICVKEDLLQTKRQARTFSLDLFAQWEGLEKNGQFRFTPPTLSIMAYRQALLELEAEGGIPAREKRYRENKAILDKGMAELGFQQYLPTTIQGHIISSFLYPKDANFDFEKMYQFLNARGMVIYPGKLSKANAFRIGNIGQIFPNDVQSLIHTIKDYLTEYDISEF